MDEKLIQSADFWKYFGSIFPSCIVIINKNGDITYENSTYKNLAVLSHTSLFHSLESDYVSQLKKIISKCEIEQKILSDKLRVRVVDDKVLYFTCYIICLENGLFALLLIDTTQKNNELIMLNNIVNTAPDPIFVKDEQHRFLYVNQAFADSLGHPIPHVVGKSDVDFFPKTESEIFYKLDRKTFKSGKTTVNEEKFTCAAGTREVSTKKSVFKTLNGSKILVGIIRDVTEINAAREYLKKYTKELKRQVDRRTKQLEMKKNDLEKAVEKLKSLNSDLDCFAHICCHELREPLRTISSFSKLVLDEYSQGKYQNIDDFLHIINQGAARMDKLIKAILEYSTNGLCTSSMSLFSANDLIVEVLFMLDHYIQERKVIINCEDMPFIYADRLQVMQLFQNLINNSIKFSSATTLPIINIRANQKNKFIEFQIEDNGIGIAKKYHKEIFLPFKRFHSRSEGSMYGIGLSLCKKIVENHGGKINMSSAENVGTTFKFLLPAESIEQAQV